MRGIQTKLWKKINRNEDGTHTLSASGGKVCRGYLRDLVKNKIVTLEELNDLIEKMPNNAESSVELLELIWQLVLCLGKGERYSKRSKG